MVSASPGHVWMECCPTQWAWATHTRTPNVVHAIHFQIWKVSITKVCLFLFCNVCLSVGRRSRHLPTCSHTVAEQGASHSFSLWHQLAQVCVSAPAVQLCCAFTLCFSALVIFVLLCLLSVNVKTVGEPDNILISAPKAKQVKGQLGFRSCKYFSCCFCCVHISNF